MSGAAEPQSLLLPNRSLPLLVYRAALPADAGAAAFERLFAAHGWSGSWRNGIYPFHHYHSTTHEVLGIYSGEATVRFGGPSGVSLPVGPGDVVVIPAGVSHKRESASAALGVVGAYPEGRSCDLCRGVAGETAAAWAVLAAVPLPASDPVSGPGGPLPRLWAAANTAGHKA